MIDFAIPLVVAAVLVIGELLHGGHSAGALPVALALAASAALWMRRRWPVLALGASGACVAILLHVDDSTGSVAVLAPAVALYSLALTRGRRAQLLAALIAVAAVVVADLLHSGGPGMLQTLGHALLVAIPLLAAEQVRNHRSNVSLLTERLQLSEQARASEAARQAEQERMRIARELHDVVAHTLTEINIQAAAAAECSPAGPARAALERIEQSSHRATAELRAILGVLRDTDRHEPPRGPAPGVHDLPELLAGLRERGLHTKLEITGQPPEWLSEVTSLAAYRIVQESLTNARRHAPGAPVTVGLHFNATQLAMTVQNANASAAAPARPGGVGITGMRERAVAVGGTLQAGQTPQGFLVRATLPYEPGR